MKKLLIIPLFVLFGCQIYEQPSNPQLNLNGRWDVVKVRVVIDKVNYGSRITVLTEDSASVNSFYVKKILNDNTLLLSQDFKGTSIDKRFILNRTTWDFQYNQLRIYEDNRKLVMERF